MVLKFRSSSWFGLVLLPLLGCSLGGPPGASDRGTGDSPAGRTSALTAQRLADRAKLAASRRFLQPSAPRVARPADGSWAAALDLPAGLVLSATLDGDDSATQVRRDLGIITPIRGDSFVLLSTGAAGAGIGGVAAPEPGTDFGDGGEPGDATSLRLTLQVPPGASILSFQYNFLSAEAPEFVGTIFNDAFSIQVDDPSGPRSFTIATVNGSKFFAISDTRGKASGFDIYTDDPGGVDTVFGTGLPDAGLTDFQPFSVPVTGGTMLTLTFAIQDNGDGILDSAVLLDALQFSAIELVDPNPDLETAAGALTASVDDLATRGRPVRGVAADGDTEVLLRVKLPAPGSVAFSLPAGTPAAHGSLRTLGGSELAAAVTPTSVVTGAGVDYAFAVYRAPADFNTGSDASSIERAVRVTAEFTPATGTGFTSQVELQIKRPPLVLARGLWSDNLYWTPAVIPNDPDFIASDPRFAITYVDQSYACNSELRVVPRAPDAPACPWTRTTPPDGEVLCSPGQGDVFSERIREALENVRRLDIAATKVDVVAQGDAGLRAREHINAPGYRNPSNLNAGDVNRLITLNTPHLGSALADAIVQARDNTGTPDEGFMCHARRLEALGAPQGGVDPGDVAGIDALTTSRISLQQTDVHGHALVGSNGKALPALRYRQRMAILSLTFTDIVNATGVHVYPCSPVQPCSTVWGPASDPIDHDTFASVVSQTGGLPVAAMTPFPTTTAPSQTDDWTDLLHATQSRLVSNRIIELLNTAVDSSTFASFPATDSQLHPGIAAAARPASPLAIPSGSLRIVSPVNGAEVFAGDTVQVEVVAEGGFAPATAAVVLGGAFATSDTAPFTIPVTVPAHALGPTKLIAIGFDASDRGLVSNLVVLDVRTRATLDTVHVVTQDPVLFGTGKHRQLAVLGTYDDGVTRDITSPAAGTVFLTSNPAIVTVSPSGVLTSVAPGIATVAVRNGGVQDSITVTVRADAAPIASAGADVAAVCALPGAAVPVHLDGSRSFDPDADPLTYTWFEVGVQIATGPAPTVLLTAGTHAITLVVSDGGASAEDSVVVTVTEDTEPPHLAIVGDNPVTTECGLPYSDRGATAIDTCDGDLTAAIVPHSNVNTRVPGNYAVDYQVTDRAHLTAAATRSVVVADRTPPVVHVRSMIELFPPDLRYREFHLSDCASALDSCGGDLAIDRNGEIIAIHSDEPDVIHFFDPGHDIVILGPSSFKLRSQRDLLRNGRVYEVEFAVRDDLGNRTRRSCFLGVKLLPHSGDPVDDGRVFTVRP